MNHEITMHDEHTAHEEHAAEDHGDHDRPGDHDRHEGHSVAMFRDKFWLSLLLTVPVLIWSPDIGEWFGFTAPSFPGSEYIPAILGTIVFLYGGLVFVTLWTLEGTGGYEGWAFVGDARALPVTGERVGLRSRVGQAAPSGPGRLRACPARGQASSCSRHDQTTSHPPPDLPPRLVPRAFVTYAS